MLWLCQEFSQNARKNNSQLDHETDRIVFSSISMRGKYVPLLASKDEPRMVTISVSETEKPSEGNEPATAETPKPRASDQGPLPIYGFDWRRDGKLLLQYLLDSEVHTFAFSVSALATASSIVPTM